MRFIFDGLEFAFAFRYQPHAKTNKSRDRSQGGLPIGDRAEARAELQPFKRLLAPRLPSSRGLTSGCPRRGGNRRTGQPIILRPIQATGALPPWPPRAVPFSLPRPSPGSSCPASGSYRTEPARLNPCAEEVLRL